jgi:hypothetical protein
MLIEILRATNAKKQPNGGAGASMSRFENPLAKQTSLGGMLKQTCATESRRDSRDA